MGNGAKFNFIYSGCRVIGSLCVSVLLALSLGFAPSVQARPGLGRHGGGMGPEAMAGGPGEAPMGSSVRALREDLRQGDPGRDGGQDGGGEPTNRCGGPCRMNPEERQQLRRDIHEAGRELYRRGPHRGMRGD